MEKRNKIFLIIACILVVLTVAIVSNRISYMSKNLKEDYIFMSSTKSKEKSVFDKWILDDIGVKAVPSYLICKGTSVLGIIPGNISKQDFEKYLKEIVLEYELLKYNVVMSDESIYNPLTQKETNFYELCNNGEYNIIEIHMIECKDCDEADKMIKSRSNTLDIRNLVDANFFRYYISSEESKIIEKYEK